MNTSEFLSNLNDAEEGWGLWVDRNELEHCHVGQYSFENDRLPKSFIHVANLNYLAHLRQKYILNHLSLNLNETILGQEWAKTFLSQWQTH